MLPITSPFTITCEPLSVVGLSRIGFMQTSGSRPEASACITCARPISSPSFVINEFNAMFCDLNGATRQPSCLKILQSPATTRLLPAFDIVPCTIITFAEDFLLVFLIEATARSSSDSSKFSERRCSVPSDSLNSASFMP